MSLYELGFGVLWGGLGMMSEGWCRHMLNWPPCSGINRRHGNRPRKGNHPLIG